MSGEAAPEAGRRTSTRTVGFVVGADMEAMCGFVRFAGVPVCPCAR